MDPLEISEARGVPQRGGAWRYRYAYHTRKQALTAEAGESWVAAGRLAERP